MELKRALPWIISLAIHAAVVIVLVGVVISRPPRVVQEIGLDVSIQSAGSDTPGVGALVSKPVKTARPARAEPPAPPQVSGDSPHGVEMTEDALPLTPAQEALSVLPRDVPLTPAQEALSVLPRDVPLIDDAAQGSSGRQPQPGARIGWEGPSRKLLRKRDPAFPAQLSATGQEVECEARITVAASGVVTRVEITRSSGYIEIDASVEAALRDYLFSRANERKDTVGTIRFSFRLERQD